MDDIYSINPSIDISLASNYGFIKNNKLDLEYVQLQKKYYILLEYFLCKKLNLNQIEIQLDKSGYFSNKKNVLNKVLKRQINLGYFFIKNNLNIEKLSLDEINRLKNLKNEEEIIKFISETFLKVIKVDTLCGKKVDNTRILYDGTGETFLKHNESLILGFIDDLSDIEISDEKWDEFNYQREKLKNDIFLYIEKQSLEKLNHKVEFIEYSLQLFNDVYLTQ